MAVIAEKLFCPDCGNEELWVDGSVAYITSCRKCGGEWGLSGLHRLCAGLIARARTTILGQHEADCFKILLGYMRNPITGKSLI